MSFPSHDQYLESKVLTASQPKLHLMLLDGAIRFGRQAQEMWTKEADFSDVDDLLARMSDIVDELAHGASSGKEKISSQFEEQYAFIYRELTACRFNEDREKLDSCLDLLAFQQETWKLVCEKLAAETETTSPPAKPQLPHMRPPTDSPIQSFTLEA